MNAKRFGRVNWGKRDGRLLDLNSRGLTYVEIGLIMNMHPDTVRKRHLYLTERQQSVRADGWQPSGALVRMRQVVALAFGIGDAEMVSRSRARSIAHARQAACYVVRAVRPKLSYPCVALLVGLRDHTTVIYSCRMVADRMARDPEYAGKIAGLVALLAGRDDVRQCDSHVAVWREFQRAAIARAAAETQARIEAARRAAEADERARLTSDDEFVAARDARRSFCGQCDRSVLPADAARCAARICGMRPALQERVAA